MYVTFVRSFVLPPTTARRVSRCHRKYSHTNLATTLEHYSHRPTTSYPSEDSQLVADCTTTTRGNCLDSDKHLQISLNSVLGRMVGWAQQRTPSSADFSSIVS